MTIGVGGSDAQTELAKLHNMTQQVQPIEAEEYQARLKTATVQMRKLGWDALYIHAGTNLKYFTGTQWHPSERLVGALLLSSGALVYVAPHFEVGTLAGFMVVEGPVNAWQEHESPYQLLAGLCLKNNVKTIGVDENLPFTMFDQWREAAVEMDFKNGQQVSQYCRSRKSVNEIALMQVAKNMTLAVHQAVAKVLRVGMSTNEVTAFINAAHKKVGAPKGSYFCIVLFGEDSAFPHGVKNPKNLAVNDMVLIDTGCVVEGYISDITRSYVFGDPDEQQRMVWQAEKKAQEVAFAAAKIGLECGQVDTAARSFLESEGFGPEYELPGLPHRTGHGIGLDIHEGPYLVRGDETSLDVGMCFSNEPMICIPGKFGIRLEDHFYMAKNGPVWFTEPAHSIDDPFGLAP